MSIIQVELMKEDDKYYLCYEKLIRTMPRKPLVEIPEYKNLAARYPHIAESVRLRTEIEGLEKEARPEEEKSVKLQKKRQIGRLNAELKRQGILKRLHGESKQEADFRRRFTINSLKQRLSLLGLRARKVCSDLQEKLQEQSRRSRRARAEKLPPSLFDLRSLDSADRGLALTEWVKKRRVRIRSE
jgi:hypothetical protein